MQRVLSSLPGAGLDLFPVCGAFTMTSRKPQLAQDMAVLVFSTLLCMDHRHLVSVECFGFQLHCRYDLEVLYEPLINLHRHTSPSIITALQL